MRRLFVLGPFAAFALAGCAADLQLEPDIGMQIAWQVGDRGQIPDDVASIEVRLVLPGQEPATTTLTVDNLPADAQGRRFTDAPLLSSLPTGVPVTVEVNGLGSRQEPLYFGRAGPFLFQPGERKYVSLRMYPIGRSAVLSFEGIGGRFLHTTTALPDGRILIAGGFDEVRSAPCPATAPGGATCFRAEASDEAVIFDPATGLFWPLVDPMLRARAGHSATLFSDGRVLIAGGAEAAVLALAPSGSTFEPLWFPEDPEPRGASLTTFEVFLPDSPSEVEDLGADGDPGRGRFVGSANPDDGGGVEPVPPGSLNDARFLHAAARPDGLTKVLLAGGVLTPGNYEVYDDVKPGGYGVYDNSGAVLGTPRSLPSALAIGERVWVVGGTRAAASNADLAEVWRDEGDSPNGLFGAFSEGSFPNETSGDMSPQPRFALLRPALALIDDPAGDPVGLAAGWLGPRCAAGMNDPTFGGPVLCGVAANRSYAFDPRNGATSDLPLDAPRSFAEVVGLPSGQVAVIGGVINDGWDRTRLVEIFTGEVSDGVPSSGTDISLSNDGRIFHDAAAMPSDGFFVAGGLNLSSDFSIATLVATAEVFYLGD